MADQSAVERIVSGHWRLAIMRERAAQIEKGYDAAHDDAHGREHLVYQAQWYAMRGEVLKAAAMLVALAEYDSRREAEGYRYMRHPDRAAGVPDGYSPGEGML